MSRTELKEPCKFEASEFELGKTCLHCYSKKEALVDNCLCPSCYGIDRDPEKVGHNRVMGILATEGHTRYLREELEVMKAEDLRAYTAFVRALFRARVRHDAYWRTVIYVSPEGGDTREQAAARTGTDIDARKT